MDGDGERVPGEGIDVRNPAEVVGYWLRLADQTGHRTHDAQSVWLQTFGITSDYNGEPTIGDLRELSARLWGLVEASVAVRARLEGDPTGQILLASYGEVEQTIDNFRRLQTVSRETFFSPLQQTGWVCLDQLTTYLGLVGDVPPARIAHGSVDALLEQTRILIDLLSEDEDLDADLRWDLVKRLLEVQEHLLRVRVGGEEEVKAAVDGLAGLMFRIGMRNRALLQHPLVDSAWRICGGLAMLVGLTADWHSLTAAGGAATLMLPLAPPGLEDSGDASGSA